MKLSESRYRNLVVVTDTEAECVGFVYVLCLIAAGVPIRELRLLTDEAVQTALQSVSQDMKRGGPIRDEVPIKNNGEVVEIDFSRGQAISMISRGLDALYREEKKL